MSRIFPALRSFVELAVDALADVWDRAREIDEALDALDTPTPTELDGTAMRQSPGATTWLGEMADGMGEADKTVRFLGVYDVTYPADGSEPVVEVAEPRVCDHSGIGLPGCEVCDMTTDRNQDRQRRGKSPVCIDCGSAGEPAGNSSVRYCDACDVSFGWMVPSV